MTEPTPSYKRRYLFAVVWALCLLPLFVARDSHWAVVAWLGALVAAGFYWHVFLRTPQNSPTGGIAIPLSVLVLVAAIFRLYRIDELPLGASPDEIANFENCLSLLNAPFHLFGFTPLVKQGWVETSNLYLGFNVAILKLTGVSHQSMKLLSVVPGVICCACFYLGCRSLVGARFAFGAACLLAVGHWHVRISRYGWDGAFLLMTFAAALALLLTAWKRESPLYAYGAGIAAGLGLYSYIASWICLAALGGSLLLEFAWQRSRLRLSLLLAFAIGSISTALPLLLHNLSRPGGFLLRAGEVAVSQESNLLLTIVGSIWRHAIMFHVLGGKYARDNMPGWPMMDIVSGLLLLLGLWLLIRDWRSPISRLLLIAFALNFAGGIFSSSQEGAPYAARVAAVMIPAFFIVAKGFEHALPYFQKRVPNIVVAQALLLTPALLLNAFMYFWAEPRNAGALRVMAYETGAIGREIAGTDKPVYLVGTDVFASITDTVPGERFPEANGHFQMSEWFSSVAVLAFSSRYDEHRTLMDNMRSWPDIAFVRPDNWQVSPPAIQRPCLIIYNCRVRDLWPVIHSRYPGSTQRFVVDHFGNRNLAVVHIP